MFVKKVNYQKVYNKWKNENYISANRINEWSGIKNQNKCYKKISEPEYDSENQRVMESLFFNFFLIHKVKFNNQNCSYEFRNQSIELWD